MRILAFAAALFAGGCARLLNSNRPDFSGPLAKPAWHNADVRIERTPLIHGGIVYAIGSPFGTPDFPRVYAFDLQTGKQIWAAEFPAKRIRLAAGNTLYVTGSDGNIHSLDARSGVALAAPGAIVFSQAAVFEGGLYRIAGGQIITPFWHATVPHPPLLAPVVTADAVYVYGFSEFNVREIKPAVHGLYAYDRKTGTLRWRWELPDKPGHFSIEGLSADASAAYLLLADKRDMMVPKTFLTAFDAVTGAEKWKHTTEMYAPLNGAPRLFEPQTLLIADFPPGKEGIPDQAGYVYRALDRASGKTAWESRGSWKYRNAVARDGLLFASDRKVHELLTENNNFSPDSWVSAVDLRSGRELWRSETVELGVFTEPAAADGMVVVGSKPFTWSSPARAGSSDVAGIWAWTVNQP